MWYFNSPKIVFGEGALAHLQGFSLEKAVLDDDMIMYLKRLMKGVDVSDDTLALDAIEAVGPGGTFLTSKHTLEWFEKEMTFPNVFERGSLIDWQRKGSKSARQRANDRARKILKDHWPEPLDLGIRKRIEEYIEKVKKEEKKKR